MKRSLIIAVSCLSLLFFAEDKASQKIDKPKVGKFRAQFTEKSPWATSEECMKRCIRSEYRREFVQTYKLAEEEAFEVYVPENYDPNRKYGVFVWINSGDKGVIKKDWIPLMDKYNLIWVGAKKSGNKHKVFERRIPLALDGLYNITKQYNVDSERFYISGDSGGGRTASMVGIMYSDIFKGGMYIVGVCNWNHPNYEFDKSCEKKALEESRYVLLTGDKDFNLADTKHQYENAYKPTFGDKATYIQVPGMKHTLPPAEYFEKGLIFLDAPLKEKAKTLFEDAEKAFKKKDFGTAMKNFKRAEELGEPAGLEKYQEIFNELSERNKLIEQYIGEKNYCSALPILKRNDKQFGSAYPQYRERIIALLKDPEVKKEREANKYLSKIVNFLKKKKPNAKTLTFLEKIANKYPETYSGKCAGEMLAELQPEKTLESE